MLKPFRELLSHFTRENNCPSKSKHALSSKKFLIILLFVSIATIMQCYNKFTGAYPDYMANMCMAALLAFTYQDKKQIEAQGAKHDI